MKKIASLRSDKTKLEDPCILLNRGLACLQNDDIKNAIRMFWEAGCGNIAIIPRLILWDEPAELGDEIDEDESWDYVNTRWPVWKNKESFNILTLFWAHGHVRSALGLPMERKPPENPEKPDFEAVARDIQAILHGKSAISLLAKKALGMSFHAACFIREADKKHIRPPPEAMETLVEMDFFVKNVVQAAISKSMDKKEAAEISRPLDGMASVQRRIHAEILKTGKLMQKNRDDRSYIG